MKNLTLAHLTISSTPAETIDAAAGAGFGAVGLRICGRRPGDPFATPIIGHAVNAKALRQRAADKGIRLSNVSAYQFYPDVTWDDIAPAIEATEALGIPVIVANGFTPDEAQFTDLFARYCEAAARANIRVALEFLPYSAVRNLEEALRIIERSGAQNAGLLLDALHLDRSGATPADIAAIDPAKIVFAQLCDAKKLDHRPSNEELLHEARFARLPAGTGELPLYEFMNALPAGLEVEYEVSRVDMADRTPAEKAQVAHEDAERFMAAYAAYRGKEPAATQVAGAAA
ncbi:MAG: sugar phosphate isomerase/epimerase [Comamonadaceae bacterium]|nr:MAG: sugar phosphate isomerase/epimerase [Comamonadaceae bacterium]